MTKKDLYEMFDNMTGTVSAMPMLIGLVLMFIISGLFPELTTIAVIGMAASAVYSVMMSFGLSKVSTVLEDEIEKEDD